MQISSHTIRKARDATIPTGLCPPAQGCEARATLGVVTQNGSTPKGLRQLSWTKTVFGSKDATPLGLKDLFVTVPRVARASQPWAECRNPFGIPGNQVTTVLLMVL